MTMGELATVTASSTAVTPRSMADRAKRALDAATLHSEVLAAIDIARVARDINHARARQAKASGAYEAVKGEITEVCAQCAAITAHGEVKVRAMYDATNPRRGGDRKSEMARKIISPDGANDLAPTQADIGLSGRSRHEASKLKAAEEAQPGIIDDAAAAIAARGEMATSAGLRREVAAMSGEPVKPEDPMAKTVRAVSAWVEQVARHRYNDIDMTAFQAMLSKSPLMMGGIKSSITEARKFLDKLEAMK